MHHAAGFIQDLAVIMALAGVVTVLFHRFKQPVVLGYIVAGVIIGPHTPPFELISNEETISTLGELGVVFLLFSLGLEFSLKKLFRVGATALVAAFVEIVVMLGIGYGIGHAFGWSAMDSLFLGAMLAISSTTIIVKALDELKLKRERFAQLIFGILIVEDILAIAMIALLSGIAGSGSVDTAAVLITLAKLALFMTVSLVVGVLVVPRLLDYVARFNSQEMLLIAVLGLCFGFCLLVIKLDYSVALGAFLIGAIIAESRQLHAIERLIEPVRDMFSAIFFVTIGLMLDPTVLGRYAVPILVISVAVIVGKIVSCSVSAFVSGQDARTSMRVGMGLAQIGEFSFIIAALGLSLKVTSDFLYPIAVAVSALTTLTTPYLIRGADPFTRRLAAAMPPWLAGLFGAYTNWVQSLGKGGDASIVLGMVRRIVLQVAINLAIVAAIFIVISYFAAPLERLLSPWLDTVRARQAVLWGGALVMAMPFLVAVYRKVKSLSLLLAEVSVQPAFTGRFTAQIRRTLAELIPAAAMFGVFVLVAALSGAILPPTDLLIAVLLAAAILLTLAWRWFVRLHARLQIALNETLDRGDDRLGH
ncbi:cation:proton antiporter [Chitinasiproducens palmae]|uniref:Transporter, CPA2 family n=1 Tax=Chitinasiproducens palmae TaxID=1770053 RepID=A0A1H2PV44_9BURK|nr:cation:proton antiporter [Chitinasiproducens palmae]SDV51109.1 transporter, CPA2 family [Chitinasiproducens palmae]